MIVVVPPISKGTKAPFKPGEESELYVKKYFPEAWHHGHGPENTILSHHVFGDHDITVKCLTSTWFIGIDWPREKQKEAEDRMWWWAAYLLYLEHKVGSKICECGHELRQHDGKNGYCLGCYHRSADSKHEDQNVGCRRFKLQK